MKFKGLEAILHNDNSISFSQLDSSTNKYKKSTCLNVKKDYKGIEALIGSYNKDLIKMILRLEKEEENRSKYGVKVLKKYLNELGSGNYQNEKRSFKIKKIESCLYGNTFCINKESDLNTIFNISSNSEYHQDNLEKQFYKYIKNEIKNSLSITKKEAVQNEHKLNLEYISIVPGPFLKDLSFESNIRLYSFLSKIPEFGDPEKGENLSMKDNSSIAVILSIENNDNKNITKIYSEKDKNSAMKETYILKSFSDTDIGNRIQKLRRSVVIPESFLHIDGLPNIGIDDKTKGFLKGYHILPTKGFYSKQGYFILDVEYKNGTQGEVYILMTNFVDKKTPGQEDLNRVVSNYGDGLSKIIDYHAHEIEAFVLLKKEIEQNNKININYNNLMNNVFIQRMYVLANIHNNLIKSNDEFFLSQDYNDKDIATINCLKNNELLRLGYGLASKNQESVYFRRRDTEESLIFTHGDAKWDNWFGTILGDFGSAKISTEYKDIAKALLDSNFILSDKNSDHASIDSYIDCYIEFRKINDNHILDNEKEFLKNVYDAIITESVRTIHYKNGDKPELCTFLENVAEEYIQRNYGSLLFGKNNEEEIQVPLL